MTEGKEHKRIREDVMRVIERKVKGTNLRILSGHTGKGELRIYCQNEGLKPILLSKPDILFVDDANRTVKSIIEIKDKDIRPKDILGILASTSICNESWKDPKTRNSICGASLYVVLNEKEYHKEGSQKIPQMKLLQDRTPKTQSISTYVICSTKEFEDVFTLSERVEESK